MARFPLPYSFARSQQLLLTEDGGALSLLLSPQASRTAVTEVLRLYAVASVESSSPDDVAQRTNAAESPGCGNSPHDPP